MNLLLAVKTLFPIWLVVLGIGFMFVHFEENRMIVGATLIAFGLTLLLRQIIVQDGVFSRRG